MAFTFGFSENDLNSETAEATSKKPSVPFTNPIDSAKITAKPKIVHLEELLPSLLGTRLSYDRITLATKKSETLFRRELFDVKQQLMAEDDFKDNSKDDLFNILIGDTDEDLKRGVYEGGLKSWECSYDLIDKLDKLDVNDQIVSLSKPFNIVELGCGTSLPSLYVFSKVIQDRKKQGTASNNTAPIRFILTDYNYEVLRLVTLPNILINWCLFALTKDQLAELQLKTDQDGNIREGEIYITDLLAQTFVNWLQSHHIALCFISGSWCRQFIKDVHSLLPNMESDTNLVVTSETIYSPPMLPVVGQMLLELTVSQESLTILTAKDIYFGVGGSINQLLEYLQENGSPFVWEVEKVDSPLKRNSILANANVTAITNLSPSLSKTNSSDLNGKANTFVNIGNLSPETEAMMAVGDYQRRNAYSEGPVCVLEPNLFLYSEPSPEQMNEFDVIINVAQEIKDYSYQITLINTKSSGKKIDYHFIPWTHSSRLVSDFPRLTQLIDKSLEANKKVLIHCQCGISRSASLILAYFMKINRADYNEAYVQLKEKAPLISPNLSLIYELIEWGQYLKTKNTCSNSEETLVDP
ncbi:hypothetical protein FOA43_003934 [Brettanomyces nanus]|uniref:protein-tyrosine-phosphatase n=1 Tax=Eeniella nana TaxID=13502 RepID=A0A875S8L9_EENNA|nr:uncharacterized protein FOA43_003934 [Brettanomyces nanus]QPG76545.1 hypothetical protein FOA43_003934 [Brettanomyces nanus]